MKLFYLTPTDFSTAQVMPENPMEIKHVHSHGDVTAAPPIEPTTGGLVVEYSSPTEGRVFVNLFNDNEDIVLQVDARFDWHGWKNVVVLNSKKADGQWGKQVETDQFPFPGCGSIIPIRMRIEARESTFHITANGIDVATYPYQKGMRPLVTHIMYRFDGRGATVKGQLRAITVLY